MNVVIEIDKNKSPTTIIFPGLSRVEEILTIYSMRQCALDGCNKEFLSHGVISETDSGITMKEGHYYIDKLIAAIDMHGCGQNSEFDSCGKENSRLDKLAIIYMLFPYHEYRWEDLRYFSLCGPSFALEEALINRGMNFENMCLINNEKNRQYNYKNLSTKYGEFYDIIGDGNNWKRELQPIHIADIDLCGVINITSYQDDDGKNILEWKGQTTLNQFMNPNNCYWTNTKNNYQSPNTLGKQIIFITIQMAREPIGGLDRIERYIDQNSNITGLRSVQNYNTYHNNKNRKMALMTCIIKAAISSNTMPTLLYNKEYIGKNNSLMLCMGFLIERK